MGAVDGKRVFVPSAAPGDLLEIEIEEDHGGWAEGRIKHVIEPAACRTTPRCPIFGLCGGCQWQHLTYASQLEWKQKILCETLERVGKFGEPNVRETLPSPQEWHYRNRIQLHVDSKGCVGFYRRRSKEVVECDACAIADERLNEELSRRRAEISQRNRGIALRVEEGEPACDAGQPAGEVDGGSFAQINTAQNEELRKTVVEWLSAVPHARILELYAGSGNFTFAIARIAERVLASDVDRRAIDAAQRRQIRENTCNVEFVCAPSAKAISRGGKRFADGCDVVLIDPPRKGCAEAVEEIVRLCPISILYISCDPATLARDARAFAERGYALVRSLPIDMFPQTFHTESLTLLQRAISLK